MIISGFPCIGKTSISGTRYGGSVIDLESSMFFVDGKRPDNWAEMYVNVAQDLAKQNYIVCVSSHKAVREEMNKRDIKFYSIFPSHELKEVWEKRLNARYQQDPTDKNKRAMDYILEHYDESVDDMANEKNPIQITDKNYNLNDIVQDFSVIDTF